MQSISNATYTLSSGLTLSYYDSTAGESDQEPALVLLHGYCGSSSYFKELVPLLKNCCRIVIPDLVGHGASSAINQPTYALEEQAALIIEWLNGLGVSNVHLLGHSLGGYITLAVAEQKPSFLSAFGLIHSTALPDSEQAKNNREQAIITVQEKGVTAFVDGLAPKLIAQDHPQRKQLIDTLAAIGYSTSSDAVIGFARGMKERPDRTSIIEQSSLPVLLISGAKDMVVSSENTFKGSNATTVCRVIEDAGHMGMLETPQQLAGTIEQFVNELKERR